MTTEDLSRRAVACKHWRWMPGMLVFGDPESLPRGFGQPAPLAESMLRARIQSVVLGRFFGSYDYAVDYSELYGHPCDSSDFFDPLPDLSDPATLGCLLALVREAWPVAPAVTSRHGNYAEGIGHSFLWVCSYCTEERWMQSHGDTEAEALVAALEAVE